MKSFMRAEEVMIGDWIMVSYAPLHAKHTYQRYQQIVGIHILGGTSFETLPFLSSISQVHMSNSIKPIPLTREIMLKFGLKRYLEEDMDEDGPLLFEDGKTYTITQVHKGNRDCWRVFLRSERDDVKITGDVFYVHDMQHKLREAGIEYDLYLSYDDEKEE